MGGGDVYNTVNKQLNYIAIKTEICFHSVLTTKQHTMKLFKFGLELQSFPTVILWQYK